MGCSSRKPAVTKSNQPWQPQKAATEFRSRELTSVCKKVRMGLAIGTFYATALKCGRELWKSPASTLCLEAGVLGTSSRDTVAWAPAQRTGRRLGARSAGTCLSCSAPPTRPLPPSSPRWLGGLLTIKRLVFFY